MVLELGASRGRGDSWAARAVTAPPRRCGWAVARPAGCEQLSPLSSAVARSGLGQGWARALVAAVN